MLERVFIKSVVIQVKIRKGEAFVSIFMLCSNRNGGLLMTKRQATNVADNILLYMKQTPSQKANGVCLVKYKINARLPIPRFGIDFYENITYN